MEYRCYSTVQRGDELSKQSDFSKSNKLLKKLPTKKKTEADKKALLSYLSGEYGVTYFNKTFIFKLEHIQEGTLQNLQSSITYDILLDMFKYYKHDLDKQRLYNKKIGKIFSDQQGTLNYDLAIILNKHSDYIIEQEKSKIKSTEIITIDNTAKLAQEHVSHKVDKTENNDYIDINKMLNEW